MKTILLSLLLAGSIASTQAAVLISLSPSNQSVSVGALPSVDVIASGLTRGQVIGAFDFTLLWNPALVSLSSYSFSGALGVNTFPAIVEFANRINMASVSLEDTATLVPLQSSQPFVLATLTFNALNVGTTVLNFDQLVPFIIADGDGVILSDASFQNGSIEITGGQDGIPEPSTVVLMTAGLAGLVMKARRRRN